MKKFKLPILILTPLVLLVSLLMITTVFADSAYQKGAGPYLVTEPPIITGATEQGGKTIITGIVPSIQFLGTIVATHVVDFTCVLGVDGAPNKCEAIQTISGTVGGSTPGSFQNTLKWSAGGDAAFTDGTFNMIPGSGTGGLADLVEFIGIFQRDEAAGLNGIYSGKYRFAGN